MLRVAKVLVKRVESGKTVSVELLGKEIVCIAGAGNKSNPTQRGKGKIQVGVESATLGIINLT